MRSLGKFTLRGMVEPTANTGSYADNGDLQRILLFDGRFDTAFKITKVICWNYEPTSTADGMVLIATDKAGFEGYNLGVMDAENNMQIGWASCNSITAGVRDTFDIIDRDNLVVQDLWIAGYNASTGSKKMNYLIECEKFDVGLNTGAYVMVRNASQDIQD